MNKEIVFSTTKSKSLSGPAKSRGEGLVAKYSPVSCDFTDELEFVSVGRLAVEIVYFGESDAALKAYGEIKNIFADGGEDFLRMSGGEVIRLDKIARVNIV